MNKKISFFNIYFDNDNYELINRSINKPIYKEKIRLRSYEKINNNTNVFLEIKKKYNQNSNKRRVSIKYKELINYLNKGIIPNTNKQIMKEIDYYFKYYGLLPKINLTTYREFDTDIYVADVIVSDSSYLKTTFAHNSYGKNIVDKTSNIASDKNAILAINGDYYGVQEYGYVLKMELYIEKLAKIIKKI